MMDVKRTTTVSTATRVEVSGEEMQALVRAALATQGVTPPENARFLLLVPPWAHGMEQVDLGAEMCLAVTWESKETTREPAARGSRPLMGFLDDFDVDEGLSAFNTPGGDG